MVREQRPELAERLCRDVAGRHRGAERPGEPVQLHVLPQDPLDERRVGAFPAQVDGEELVLLAAEVLDRLREEQLDVRGACRQAFLRAGVGCRPQPARLDELVVVVVGERCERRVPLHVGLRESAAPRIRSSPRSVSVDELGVEVPCDGVGVGPRDAPRVGAEALLAERAQILAVRVEHVLAAHVTGRVEEREADAHRDLEQARALASRDLAQPVEDPCQLVRRGKRRRVPPDLLQRAPERLDLERWDVDQPRARAGDPFESAEQLVDRPRLRPLGQHALAGELADERVEVGARAAGHVRRRREHPERGEPERGDGAQLDDVPGALPDGEPSGIGLVLVLRRRARLDSADQLDRHAQQVLRGRLVQPRRAHDPRKRELERLVERPAEHGGDRTDDPFGQREQEGRGRAWHRR